MKAKIALAFLFSVLLVDRQSLRAGEIERKLPIVTAKVAYAEGSFFGYGLLLSGDTMKLDLEALDGVTNLIAFSKGPKSPGRATPYIPLPTPLRIDWMKQDAKAQVLSARLIAGSKTHDGTERIIIDIERAGEEGSMSIIEEGAIVHSFARLDCTFSMR